MALRRMEYFGVDRHLIADASLVTGLVGQRLVPLLCEKCYIPWVEKAPELASDIRTSLERYCTVEWGSKPGKLYFRNHEGCDHCRNTIPLTGCIISRGVTGHTGHCRGCTR